MSRTAIDDQYFPSLLTGGSTSPKPKENNAHGANRNYGLDPSWASGKRGPRLTFAESLYMDKKKTVGDVDIEESPFNMTSTTMNMRKRKPHSTTRTSPGDDEEDIPPPPTSSLADPASFLSRHLEFNSLDDRSIYSQPLASSSSSNAFFEHDAWGSDQQYWVTIYGFPLHAKSFVLQHFQSLGDVLNYSCSAVSGGNWLYLRYHTRLQAEKALTLDGKPLTSSIMIGVKKCLPSEVEGVREEPISKLYYTSQKAPGAPDIQVDPIIEEDIMLPPTRRQDVCSRLLRFLFNW